MGGYLFVRFFLFCSIVFVGGGGQGAMEWRVGWWMGGEVLGFMPARPPYCKRSQALQMEGGSLPSIADGCLFEP